MAGPACVLLSECLVPHVHLFLLTCSIPTDKVDHAIDSLLPEGNHGAEKVYYRAYNNEKMKRVLELKTRSLEETMRDSLEFYKSIPAQS